MRSLFELDMKDYESTRRVFSRPSVRSLIIRGGKIAMVHSLKYDYYKFPGGGIEEGETLSNALIRETLEESGLVVIPESIREYGVVRRIQKSDREFPAAFDYLFSFFRRALASSTVSPSLVR